MPGIRRVRAGELALARELHNRFTAQDRPMTRIRSWYEAVSELFPFAVENEAVIGVCTGRPRGTER